MNKPLSLRILAGLLLALAGAAYAQVLMDWVDETQQCWLAHEPVQILVTGAPEGAVLDWDDGTLVDLPAGDGTYEHVYVPGSYFPVVVTADGDPIGEAPRFTFYAYDLSVDDLQPLPGQTITLTLNADPDDDQLMEGGEIRWGDGATEMVSGGGTYTHAYAAPGSYPVELSPRANLPHCVVPGGTVSVPAEAGNPEMHVHPTRGIPGQPIYADVIDEPPGGSIDWADGAITDLNGSGGYRYGYDMAGEYLVTLLDASGAPLASQLVVITEPRLALLSEDPATVGEQVTVLAEGNVDPAELAWGDGHTATVPAGGATLTHVYDQTGFHELVLADAATLEELAWLNLEVAEPERIDVDEAITILDIDYRAGEGFIAVMVLLEPLAEGHDYMLRSEDISRHLQSVGPSETITLEYPREGSYTLSLERHATGEVRATAPVHLEWDRGDASMSVVTQGPYQAGDTLTLLLTGLNPDYEYVVRPFGNGGFQRTVTGVELWEELVHYPDAGLYEATITL